MIFGWRPRAHSIRRRSPLARLVVLLAAAAVVGLVTLRRSQKLVIEAPYRALVSAVGADDVEAEEHKGNGGPCEAVRVNSIASAQLQLQKWEKLVAKDRIINGFGSEASRLLDRTLASFDAEVDKLDLPDNACRKERDSVIGHVQQQLHSLFLVQRSIVEQELFQSLRKDLLRRMRRKKSDLDVREKLPLLHDALKKYDAHARDLKPSFVQDSEHGRAERRLSELQWGIEDSDEGRNLKQKWKMDRLRRVPTKQSRGLSVSLSPGIRVLFRPDGLGNLQIWSKRQVGPPHNPNEVSIGVLNDGRFADVYSQKSHPPKVMIQPTIGVDLNVG